MTLRWSTTKKASKRTQLILHFDFIRTPFIIVCWQYVFGIIAIVIQPYKCIHCRQTNLCYCLLLPLSLSFGWHFFKSFSLSLLLHFELKFGSSHIFSRLKYTYANIQPKWWLFDRMNDVHGATKAPIKNINIIFTLCEDVSHTITLFLLRWRFKIKERSEYLLPYQPAAIMHASLPPILPSSFCSCVFPSVLAIQLNMFNFYKHFTFMT